jgi:hypothetical protein
LERVTLLVKIVISIVRRSHAPDRAVVVQHGLDDVRRF